MKPETEIDETGSFGEPEEKPAPFCVLIHLKYEKNREDIGLFGIWRD
ncbi:hypothetical protein PMZ85_19075 [Escherichia coli]|nr:hypothetical protein [Escherichia coli]MDB7002784.1 hypothetical protein [Escherichia coli]MDB7017737.1 hypothetical protein [Escherichia coli]